MSLKKHYFGICIVFVLLFFTGGCSFTEDWREWELYEAKVVSVVDGDTIKIRFNSDNIPSGCEEQERVRLIGINTPELFTTPPEFFAKKAHDFTNMLYLEKIYIEFGDTSSRDIYGRLLAYVRLDGTEKWKKEFEKYNTNITQIISALENNTFLFNEAILLAGYAYYYDKYMFDNDYMSDFESAEEMAEINNLGIWQ